MGMDHDVWIVSVASICICHKSEKYFGYKWIPHIHLCFSSLDYFDNEKDAL